MQYSLPIKSWEDNAIDEWELRVAWCSHSSLLLFTLESIPNISLFLFFGSRGFFWSFSNKDKVLWKFITVLFQLQYCEDVILHSSDKECML